MAHFRSKENHRAGGVREPQPALGIVRGRRITNRDIAKHTGYSEQWISIVLLGQGRPSEEFKVALAEMVAEPVEVLFRAEERNVDDASS